MSAQTTVMRPTQFVTQCVTNRERLVKHLRYLQSQLLIFDIMFFVCHIIKLQPFATLIKELTVNNLTINRQLSAIGEFLFAATITNY